MASHRLHTACKGLNSHTPRLLPDHCFSPLLPLQQQLEDPVPPPSSNCCFLPLPQAVWQHGKLRVSLMHVVQQGMWGKHHRYMVWEGNCTTAQCSGAGDHRCAVQQYDGGWGGEYRHAVMDTQCSGGGRWGGSCLWSVLSRRAVAHPDVAYRACSPDWWSPVNRQPLATSKLSTPLIVLH